MACTESDRRTSLVAPHIPQDLHITAEFIRQLEHAAASASTRTAPLKKHSFTLPSGRTIDSWRINEWQYKSPCLPTMARGLFTYQLLNGTQAIAARGYDKFFNVDELTKTRWPEIQANTQPPYHLTIKENGCIIFLAGLDDDTLLVCSKHVINIHTIDPVTAKGHDNLDRHSHAAWGNKLVNRLLQKCQKSPADLARRLYQMNATAVAEMCDDEFEEHVLPYPPSTAGLYLHGINLNLPLFHTFHPTLIHQFALEWGFIPLQYTTFNDVPSLRSFLLDSTKTGSYQGRDTEGFVIRCHSTASSPSSPPVDWFFKFKFDQPYLMYRQWREATKAMIKGKSPTLNNHRQLTQDYLEFARRKFNTNPELKEAYLHNHGIISLRNEFIQSRSLQNSDIIRSAEQSSSQQSNLEPYLLPLPSDPSIKKNVFLVPIATIGCGKTTLSRALMSLFPWAHVQNDDMPGKRGKWASLLRSTLNAASRYPVVIIDRNNHQKRERQQIISQISQQIPTATFIALHFAHREEELSRLRFELRSRVLRRGDNHQTIRANQLGEQQVDTIMNGFISRFEALDMGHLPDSQFKLAIELSPLATPLENLRSIVTKLYACYPGIFPGTATTKNSVVAADTINSLPTDSDLSHAVTRVINESLTSCVDAIKITRSGSASHPSIPATDPLTPGKIEYFGVRLAEKDVHDQLTALFPFCQSGSMMYHTLRVNNRIQKSFHVTLIHRSQEQTNASYWGHLCNLWRQAVSCVALQTSPVLSDPQLTFAKGFVRLTHLLWDDEIMCFIVQLHSFTLTHPDNAPVRINSVNHYAHITIGTINQSIKPKQANDLIQRWHDMKDNVAKASHTKYGSLKYYELPEPVEISGTVNAVMMRNNKKVPNNIR